MTLLITTSLLSMSGNMLQELLKRFIKELFKAITPPFQVGLLVIL
jgi:hypothetical protein